MQEHFYTTLGGQLIFQSATRRLRHNFGVCGPAANAPACCGNMDNLKEFPANGGEHCLAIAVLIYGSGSRALSYLATRTSKRRFTRLEVNGKLRFTALPSLRPTSRSL